MKKLLILAIFWPLPSQGAELAMSRFFIKNITEETKMKTQEIGIGSRYGKFFSRNEQWFGEAAIVNRAYSGVDNTPEPNNDITVGGGYAHFFRKLSPRLQPFARAGAAHRIKNDVTLGIEKTTKGIYGYGEMGIRLHLSYDGFFELNFPIFSIALSETSKTKTANGDQNAKRTEIGFDTDGQLTAAYLSLGMYLDKPKRKKTQAR